MSVTVGITPNRVIYIINRVGAALLHYDITNRCDNAININVRTIFIVRVSIGFIYQPGLHKQELSGTV